MLKHLPNPSSLILVTLVLGSFGLSVTSGPREDARFLTLRGDFNGDGNLDSLEQPLLPGFPVTATYGEYDGAEATEQQSWTSDSLGLDWSAQRTRIVVGDFDGDGRADLLLQALQPGAPSHVVRADHDGRFHEIAQTIPADRSGLEWTGDHATAVAGDFDGDGRA